MAWVGLGNVASKLMMFVATVWIANRLLADAFGAVNVAFSVASYIGMVLFAGVDIMATRHAAAAPTGSRAPLTGEYAVLRALLSCAGALVCAGAALFLPGQAGTLTLLYAVSFVPQALCMVSLFYGVEWAWPVTAYFVGGRVVYLGLIVMLVRGPRQAVWVPIAFGLALLAENAFMALLWLHRHGCAVGGSRFDWGRWLPAVPVTVASAALLLHENCATVSLGFIRGTADAGIYSAAWRLVYVAVSMALLLSFVFMARLVRVRAGSVEAARRFFRRTMLMVTGGGILCAVIGMLLARPVVALFYRDAYASSAPVLAVAMWLMAAVPARVFALQTLNGCGAYRAAIVGSVAGAVVSLGATVAGAYARGPLGAAAGTVAGELVLAVILTGAASRALAAPRA